MAKLFDIDSRQPIPDCDKGGYGLALEKLADVLGAEPDTVLLFQCSDGPIQQLDEDDEPGVEYILPDVRQGWVNVSDGEGSDALYLDGKLMATVSMGARGSWDAWATLADDVKARHSNARRLHNQGANSELLCDEWQ